MTRTGWLLVVSVVAVLFGLYLSRRPWQVYAAQRADRYEALQKLKEVEVAQAALTRQKLKMESPLGRQVLAREKGLRKSGEKPFQFASPLP